MTGQHVGVQSDALTADPALEAARAAQQAALAAIKPRAQRWAKHDIGDGDRCPLVAEHGRMFVLQGQPPVQYCPDQSHDKPPTRKLWPYHHFEDAVVAYHQGNRPAHVELPVLDIGELS